MGSICERAVATETWRSFRAWSNDQLVEGEHLSTTMLVLWRAYRDYCAEWGFERAPAEHFALWIESEEGVRMLERPTARVVIGRACLSKPIQCVRAA